ncbi:MAG: DNA-processing protein DprA, partial [bacterium]
MSKNLLDLLSLSLFPKFKLGLVHNLLEETNNDVKKLCDSISNKYESKEIVSTKIIAEAIIEKTKLLGIHAIDYMDPYYPKLLKNIPTPPLVIYAKGNVELLKLQNKTISIVGTRQPDKYGVDNTKYF